MTTRWNRPLLWFAVLMAGSALVSLVGIFADPRILTGVPIWDKPFKFSVSFGLYAVTIAWMLSVLRRRSRIAEVAAFLVALAATAEMVIIVGQVIRGTTSHYNETTPLNAQLWQLMGESIAVLFVAHLVIAIIAIRQGPADRVAAWAIRLGLFLALGGMLAAVPMVLPSAAPGVDDISGAHTVGLPDGGPGLPLLGWSTVGGDLRIGHFVGLHGLQAMPLLAMLLDRFAGSRLSPATRVRLLVLAAAAYASLTASLTWQALRAQPLLKPDALTLGVWGLLALTTAVGALAIMARDRQPLPVPLLAPANLK